MTNEKQNDSSKDSLGNESKLGKKPIGLEGGRTGGQIDGPTGSSLPDEHPNLQDLKKKD